MMRATYHKALQCQCCMDYPGWNDSQCESCKKQNTIPCLVVQVGVGFLGNKSVIQTSNGKLETVLTEDIRITD